MAYQRKLGRTAAQRKALLRNQVTNLIWYGRIETTLARAKGSSQRRRAPDHPRYPRVRQHGLGREDLQQR